MSKWSGQNLNTGFITTVCLWTFFPMVGVRYSRSCCIHLCLRGTIPGPSPSWEQVTSRTEYRTNATEGKALQLCPFCEVQGTEQMWGTVRKLIRHTQTCHWICPKPFRLGGSQFWVFATNSRWLSEPQCEASSEMYLQHKVSNSESLNIRPGYCEVFLLGNTQTPGCWSDITESHEFWQHQDWNNIGSKTHLGWSHGQQCSCAGKGLCISALLTRHLNIHLFHQYHYIQLRWERTGSYWGKEPPSL